MTAAKESLSLSSSAWLPIISYHTSHLISSQRTPVPALIPRQIYIAPEPNSVISALADGTILSLCLLAFMNILIYQSCAGREASKSSLSPVSCASLTWRRFGEHSSVSLEEASILRTKHMCYQSPDCFGVVRMRWFFHHDWLPSSAIYEQLARPWRRAHLASGSCLALR